MARAGATRPVMAEPRARLAVRQAELIRALYAGPPAKGLDARMVAITSAALADKRARAVARAWPALARGLRTAFAERFAAYARLNPPPEGGAQADGLAFSRVLARERHLPDDARIQRMLAATRVKLYRNRLVARRCPWPPGQEALCGKPHRASYVARVIMRRGLLGARPVSALW